MQSYNVVDMSIIYLTQSKENGPDIQIGKVPVGSNHTTEIHTTSARTSLRRPPTATQELSEVHESQYYDESPSSGLPVGTLFFPPVDSRDGFVFRRFEPSIISLESKNQNQLVIEHE